MNFDLRLPIGLMFTIYGVLLTVYGFMSDKATLERSLNININLIWGLILLVFGASMLLFAILGKQKEAAQPKAEERAKVNR